MRPVFEWPGLEDRCLIVGASGSGKTWAAIWQLSQRGIDDVPWVMFDFKEDPSLEMVPVNGVLTLDDEPPERAGLFVCRGDLHDWRETIPFLSRCYRRGNTGLLIDELQQFGQANPGLMDVYNRGRTRHIPIIALCQRPVRVDRSAVTQSNYVQIFEVFSSEDRRALAEDMPREMDDLATRPPLPRYESFWVDRGQRAIFELRPFPGPEKTRAAILPQVIALEAGEPIEEAAQEAEERENRPYRRIL